ncbi:hypothetical protein OAU50_03670 [Planctomycetota bacterium]|nr:hypothetical protein [Planctomycetota bacterium]
MKTLAILCLVAMCGSVYAEASDDLANELKLGKSEKSAAKNWYEKFPEWVMASIKKNDFPQTHLSYGLQGKKMKATKGVFNKFEVRDANKKQFQAFFMARNGNDNTGNPIYKITKSFIWLRWSEWPVEHIVETYPVKHNDDAAVVGFGMWIYSKKKYNELANRVLTAVAKRTEALRPKIEAYLCEKEKWDDQAGSLIEWNVWDTKFQLERTILIPAAEEEKRFKARETASEKAFKDILSSRGAYKGRAPRKQSPKKMLVWIEWDIKMYKKAYASSEFFKLEKTQATLELIQDSITDDLALMTDNLKNINDKYKGKDKPKDLKNRVLELEILRKIDPLDINLLSKVANLWYKYANPADHGNGCDRVEGIKKAIPLYEELLELYPFNTAYLISMGRCYQAMEDSKNARIYYEKVIDIDGPNKGLSSNAEALIRNMEQKDQNRSKKK